MRRFIWLWMPALLAGISGCDLLKKTVPTLTVLAVFGEVGPATGPVEQALGMDLPTETLDPSVQTALVYVADEAGVVKTARVSLDGVTLPFQDTVDLYFVPVADSIPVPAPMAIRFGTSRLVIDHDGQTVELSVPEGATLQDPVVNPDTVQAGQAFSLTLNFTGQADSLKVQISGDGVSFDTTVTAPASPLTLNLPDTLTAGITSPTILGLTVTVFHTTTGGDGITPVSMRMVVRSITSAIPVTP